MKPSATSLYLDHQLCFPLYAASRLTTKIYTPLLAELDLTYPQYLVMLVLWQHPKQSVNQIGEKLMLASNTLTPLLKRLEQKKLISRARSKSDERTVFINITKEGDALKEKALCIPEKILHSFSDQSVSITEILQFQQTLNKLVDTLQRKTSETNP